MSRAPSHISGINWASPLARDLALAIPFTLNERVGRDYVYGKTAALGGVSGDWVRSYEGGIPGWLHSGATGAGHLSMPYTHIDWATPGQGTASIWCRMDTPNSGDGIFVINDFSDHYAWTDGFVYSSAFSTTRPSVGNIGTRDVLHNYTTTHDGTTRRFFWNGQETTSDSVTFKVPSKIILGGADTSGAFKTAGFIGPFAMWTRAISASEVRALYSPQHRWDIYNTGYRLITIGTAAAGGGEDVSVTPGSIQGDLTEVAPSVTAGALSITPAANTGTVQIVNPSVELGALSLTPAALTGTLSIVSPSVTAGSLSITPASLTGTLSVVAPSIVLGALSLTPAAIAATLSTVDPSVTTGGTLVNPTAIALTGAVVAPTVELGALSLTPSAVALTGDVVAPSAILGALSITPASLQAVLSTVDPSVSDALSITPAAITLTGTVVDPSSTLSSVSVTPTAETLSATAVNANAVLGSISLTPTAATLNGTSVDPSVLLGALALTPAAVVLNAAVVDPSVGSSGDATITPTSITLTGTVVDPTVAAFIADNNLKWVLDDSGYVYVLDKKASRGIL